MGEWASVEDVTARYEGVITADRREWVSTLIDDAESVLREEIPSLQARLTDERTNPATVVRVVCNMVLSVLRNPSGFTAQTAGEFSYSYAGNPGAGGVLRLDAADRRALVGRPQAGTLPDGDPALIRPLRRDSLGRSRWEWRYGQEMQ